VNGFLGRIDVGMCLQLGHLRNNPHLVVKIFLTYKSVSPILPTTKSKFLSIINLVRNTSKVRAYVDVEYHGLALYGFSVVESNSNLIVFPPSKSANDRFYPVIDFRDPFVQKKFSEVILNGLKEYTTNNCESDRKAQ